MSFFFFFQLQSMHGIDDDHVIFCDSFAPVIMSYKLIHKTTHNRWLKIINIARYECSVQPESACPNSQDNNKFHVIS